MRYKLLLINSKFLLSLLIEGNIFPKVKVIKGLPTDVKFVYVIDNTLVPRAGLQIVISSETFPELKDGENIPEFENFT
jgi:hypothetical protein